MFNGQIPIISFAATLTACAGTNFKWEDTERVKPGMTEAEVVSILGRPYSKTQTPNVTILVWSFATAFGGAKTVAYQFVDGKVTGSTAMGKQ